MTQRPVTPASARSARPETARRPLRVLYAEDLKELRELMEIVLQREGHQIETVPDGSEAIEKIRANPDGYDLLITDHHMPVMNGLDLVRAARELEFTGKVMVFSSEVSPLVHEKYGAFDVDRIVHKPVFPAELRSTIYELFATAPNR